MAYKDHILLRGELRVENNRDKGGFCRIIGIAEGNTTRFPCLLHRLQMEVYILGVSGRYFSEEREEVVFLGWGKELFRSVAQGLTIYKEYLVFCFAVEFFPVGKEIKSRKRVKEVKRQLYP